MLNIYFGDMPEAIYNTSAYYNNNYCAEWICDDFAKSVNKGVDRSEVIDKYLIKSPVLGLIPPTMLSGGTKTLLLIKNCPDMVSTHRPAATTVRSTLSNWHGSGMSP